MLFYNINKKSFFSYYFWENVNECPWGIGYNTEINNFATKSCVNIINTKVKICIFKTNFY